MSETIQEISLDAQLIRDRLQNASVGDIITYDELSGLIGRDVRAKAMGAINTARKHAMKNKNMVFRAVANEGLQRMSDSEIVSSVDGDLKRVRRTVRRSSTKITRVDFGKLSKEEQVDHNAKLSMLGVLAQFASKPALTTIRSKVSDASTILPIGKTLEAFQ